jgi:hypothetical protein
VSRTRVAWHGLIAVYLVLALATLSGFLPQQQVHATPDSLKLPFPAGDETWDVINGYGQGGHGPIIADEKYALDIAKLGSDQAAGKVVVAPVGLTVLPTAHGFSCSSIGYQGVGVFARMDGRPTNHYLKICHFDKAPFAQHYNQGEPFVVDAAGKQRAITFKQGTTSHIHLSLFSSDDPNLASSTRQPIPFDNDHGYPLEGLSLGPGQTHKCVKNNNGARVSGVCDLRSSQPALNTPINVSVALIIDSSGSMATNDPLGRRKEAAKFFIDLAQIGDKIAVIDFDHGVRTWASLRAIQTQADRNALKSAVDNVDSFGQTDLGLGLQEGYNQLLSDTSGNKKATVFLTDGRQEASTPYNNQHLLFKNKGWPIYTICLSSSADVALLRRIATDTGGKNYSAATSTVLQEIYRELSSRLQNQIPLGTHEFTIFPGQTLDFTAPVAVPSAQLTFSTSWPGSDVSMRLTTPNGTVIDANTVRIPLALMFTTPKDQLTRSSVSITLRLATGVSRFEEWTYHPKENR